MSVGLQRLREEPDVIRQGAIDKGEDPALVDRAIALDAAPARLQGEADALRKPRRTRPQKRIGAAIKGGAAARRPGGRRSCAAASTAAGVRIAALDAELAAAEAELDDLLLRIPNPPDPEVPVGGEEASVIVRTWGEPRTPHAAVSAADGSARGRAGRTGRSASRSASSTSPRGAKIAGSGFPLYKGAGARAPAGAHRLLPRRPHRASTA